MQLNLSSRTVGDIEPKAFLRACHTACELSRPKTYGKISLVRDEGNLLIPGTIFRIGLCSIGGRVHDFFLWCRVSAINKACKDVAI